MTDRYCKLIRAVPVSKTAALPLALTIMPYGIPNFLLIYNGPKFVSKFFNALCGSLGVK